MASLVRSRTGGNAVVFSLQHSGSLRYYGSRMTIQWPNFDASWLDRGVAWLDAHGAHPYALLEEWEVSQFREKFAASSVVGRLDMPPVLQYGDGAGRILLFDLQPSGDAGRPERVPEGFGAVRCAEPAAVPGLVLK